MKVQKCENEKEILILRHYNTDTSTLQYSMPL